MYKLTCYGLDLELKVLECSSAGDKRFSAFYATVRFNGVVDTIEHHYQKAKRNAKGLPCKKGEPVAYVVLFGKQYPPTILTPFYRYLWFKYLKANPELVAYASDFHIFNDKFRGKSINCQADCVCAYVNRDTEFYSCIKPILRLDQSN